MPLDPRYQITALVVLALLPPLLFAVYLRNRERNGREPLSAVFGMFLYGGTAGIVIAVLLHWLFDIGFAGPAGNFGLEASFVAVVIAAPIVEELAKGLGLGYTRNRISELEDGLVYGAAIGLGFAATENLFYGFAAFSENGFDFSILTIAVRIVSSMLLHAGASGLLGFGYGAAVLKGGVAWQTIPFYVLAVALHALYNFLVSGAGTLLGEAWADGLGFVAALVLVFGVIMILSSRIKSLDRLPHA